MSGGLRCVRDVHGKRNNAGEPQSNLTQKSLSDTLPVIQTKTHKAEGVCRKHITYTQFHSILSVGDDSLGHNHSKHESAGDVVYRWCGDTFRLSRCLASPWQP